MKSDRGAQQEAEGWRLLAAEGYSLAIKAQALLRVIDAHYWRAREHLDTLPLVEQRRIHGKRYCPSYQLDIDVYTRHWLSANGDRIAPEVMECVRDLWFYDPEQSPFLAKGQTTYAVSSLK